VCYTLGSVGGVERAPHRKNTRRPWATLQGGGMAVAPMIHAGGIDPRHPQSAIQCRGEFKKSYRKPKLRVQPRSHSIRLQVSGPGGILYHGPDPGGNSHYVAGNPTELRQRGAYCCFPRPVGRPQKLIFVTCSFCIVGSINPRPILRLCLP